ncbi:MAG: SpoIIE family protein phosphatase [Bacteroidia bacterium]|nr:SpoIIE family protein phosphatase [Bacteroidia bacterium]MDW8158470.1 SpoIIE family protein phosphatase [Bacteroidia bacterium]
MVKPIILCVEDNPQLCEALVEQIDQRIGDDFDCLAAPNAIEALEIIDEIIDNGKELAVVIADQTIPNGIHGDEFLIRVHSVFPETIKILLCEKHELSRVANAVEKASLYRYILKPWEEYDLALTIEEAARSYLQYLQLVQYNQYNRLLRSLNRAMQELSGEIEYEKLIKRFINTAIQITEAEIGFLFLYTQQKLNIAAVAFSKAEQARRLQRDLVKPQPSLLQEILISMKQVLHRPFAKDYRMAASITHKGNTLGYVYVENSISGNVFDVNHKEVLQMFASQMAISLENARLYRNLEKKSNELIQIKEIIETKEEDINENITYTSKILRATLPNPKYFLQLFADSFLFEHPREQIGGDFLWWSEKNDLIFFAVVDCTGTGVPGAFMAIVVNNLLTQIINQYELLELEAIMQMLNLQLQAAIDEDYALSLSFCCLNPDRNLLKFLGVKRSMLIIREGETIEIQNNRFYLDNRTDPRIYFKTTTVDLYKGDVLFLYTNGITNQLGGKEKKKLGIKRIKDFLIANNNLPLPQQGQALQKLLQEWRGNLPILDDMLAMAVKI